MSRPILVVGAKGMLGTDLVITLKKSCNVVALGHADLDVTNESAVQSVVRDVSPRMLINATGYTAVDKAEAEPELAFALNSVAVRHLAAATAAGEMAMVHFSTDYVFDGTGATPYREDAPTAPIGVYGKSKLAGEEALRECNPRHVIIRTAWLYGQYGRNFITTMIKLARERDTLRVVHDQVGSPTWTRDLAEAVARVMATNAPWGTYHYCGKGQTTWHELASIALEQAAQHETLAVRNIEAIKTRDFPTPATRPPFSVLACDKLGLLGVYPPPWRESVARFIEELYA